MMDLSNKIENLNTIFELVDDNGKTPNDIVLICRQVLEKSIDIILELSDEKKPANASLLELINNQAVKDFFETDVIIDDLHYVRIVGMRAHHGEPIKKTQAKVAKENTKFLIDFISQRAYIKSNNVNTGDKELYATTVPFEFSKPVRVDDPTEAQTRKTYIDTYLQEAGWEVIEPQSTSKLANGKEVKCGLPIPGKACCEIEVEGLDNASGKGFCDYVLYGNDGKPLAIVEAKRTSVDPIAGQQQVREYGQCMYNKYGYIPVLYYTNGHKIFIIDGKYPSREIRAFHNKDELSNIIFKRKNDGIKDLAVNMDIAGRPYQTMAITKICERFNQMHRRGLLVMATGTGKTRTAIALVELLTRNDYIKNVLFLADRTSLVKQAFKNFKKLLPNMTYCVASERNLADEPNARITFCTHQTMTNYIDGETKEYSIGRFDLIIIDEAHRSIFDKYSAIFDYFDSLLVGLTATPKDEVDKNTYDLFECESGVPNYAYSLEEAIKDHYLVPYKLVNRTSQQLNEGINYDSLSEEDKKMVNMLSDESYEDGDLIKNNKLIRKIYNRDTCRGVLEDLMTKGQRVEQGQLLGKTIIFAANHFHAMQIVDVFNEMYPMYPNWCKLIDNQVKNSDHLIEEFELDPTFRIAVSVDMLDTGIDVPSVLNLVFFKRVNSNTKLIQMIGRGTRLCPDLIDGKNKNYFLIFDYFSNLKDKPETIRQPVTVTQKIFETRLNMMCEMQTITHQINPEHKSYYKELMNIVLNQVKAIKDNGSNRISVRSVMAVLDKYYNDARWEYISVIDQKEILYLLKPLIESETKDDYVTLSFDLKMLRIEEYLIVNGNITGVVNLIKTIREIAQALLQKACIEDVFKKANVLQEIYLGEKLVNPIIRILEYYRKEIRHLIPYLKEEVIVKVAIDNSDEMLDGEQVDDNFIDIRTYREKVIDYFLENSNNPTILKIKNLEPLTKEDFDVLEDIMWVKLGDKNDYYQLTKIENLAAFIRSIVGIEQEAINQKFAQFLNGSDLTGEQMEFINSIVNYVRENGDIEPKDMIQEEPFKDYIVTDLFGAKANAVVNVVNMFHSCVSV